MDRALVAVLAASMLAMNGCGNGEDGSGSGRAGPSAPGTGRTAQPVITANSGLGRATGRGDPPKAQAQVGVDCRTMLGNRDFKTTAEKMGQVASGGGSEGEKAIARVCEAAAKANMRNFSGALETAQEAEEDIGAVDRSLRPEVEALLYHTAYVSAAAVGDDSAAQEALARLKQIGGDVNVYIEDACMVAPDPAALPECATVTSSPTTTGSPPVESPTPVTPGPEDSRTEPEGETTPTGSPADETSEPPDTENGDPQPTES
ncbi:hypothetical protein [Nonomuraea sp. NPDC050643]|uniref:hypothetical protein n=1 Tax=Nonomuraea sp. NPDC050643 TaxID=3155660 RepID=UPI0033CED228